MQPLPQPPRASRLARFIIAGTIALVIMQLAPFEGRVTPIAESPEVAALAKSIETLHIEAFARQLNTQQTTPTLLFIFASWCPYCQKHAPVIEQLAADYAGKMTVRAISIDKDITQLAAYLRAKPTALQIQRVESTDGEAFSRLLADTSSQFTGAIPQTILLGADGKLLTEVTGFVPYPALKSALEKHL